MKKMKRVILAHPLQQHSFRTAEALMASNALDSYHTTIYYRPEKPFYRLLGRMLDEDSVRRMRSRCLPALTAREVSHRELTGLLYLMAIRKDKSKKIEPWLYRRIVSDFGKDMFRLCRAQRPDVLWMYDTTAWACFPRMRKAGMATIRVMDLSSAAAPYVRKLLLKELEKEPDFRESLEVKLQSYPTGLCDRYLEEIESAQYFVVPSRFAADSLVDCGVSRDKIHIVPYGVDTVAFHRTRREARPEGKIRFLFVGRIEAVKGVHHLIRVFRELQDEDVELDMVGAMQGGMERLLDGCKNVRYLGLRRREEMPEVYGQYDAFLMPSMWEGHSLSVFEAMASGLPAIVSNHSGADDVIEDGKEGFVFEYGDVESLKDRIRWCVCNRLRLEEMGRQASEKVSVYTWEKYNAGIAKVLTVL